MTELIFSKLENEIKAAIRKGRNRSGMISMFSTHLEKFFNKPYCICCHRDEVVINKHKRFIDETCGQRTFRLDDYKEIQAEIEEAKKIKDQSKLEDALYISCDFCYETNVFNKEAFSEFFNNLDPDEQFKNY